MGKTLKIDYDKERGTTRVEVDNATPLEVGNALSNICAGVYKLLIDVGFSPDEASKQLTVACSAGIAGACARLDLGKNNGRTKIPVS